MLAPCPASPNCVSTEATDARHHIAPFQLASGDAEAWGKLRTAVLSLPRTRLQEERENYLRLECRSAVFGFVDDLELERRPAEQALAIRSASRLGRYDFGVNRRRTDRLRRLLRDRGLLR